MDKRYLNEIESIFDEKEAKEQAIAKKEKDRKDEEERRLQNFFYKRETLYKPLFENIKKIVEERGMKCVIENEKEEDGSSQPQIKITFIEKDNAPKTPSQENVYFAITFDKINNNIFIYENTVSAVRAKSNSAKYDVEGVTEDFLAMRLVKLIKEIVLK
jgi:signal recognition particle subunit SEC65